MRRILAASIVIALFGLGLQAAADQRFRLTPDASGQIPYFIASGADGSGYKPG